MVDRFSCTGSTICYAAMPVKVGITNSSGLRYERETESNCNHIYGCNNIIRTKLTFCL